MTSILNISKLAAFIFILLVGLMMTTASFVSAREDIGGVRTPAQQNQNGLPTRPGQDTSGQDSVKTTGVAPSVSLESPLKNIGSIEGLLVAILNIVIILMIPIIVFFIILAGFKYVTAQGNASQVEDATRSLTYAIIGGVLILGAVALSQIIANVVKSF